jgi:hypothetical protein
LLSLALFAEDPGEALEDVVDAVPVLVVIRVAHHPPAQLNVLLPPLQQTIQRQLVAAEGLGTLSPGERSAIFLTTMSISTLTSLV